MPNSPHLQGMTLPLSTYNKLYELRKNKGFTSWNEVVLKLIEMDQKYNRLEKTIEYEFITLTNSKVFRVTFGSSKPLVEYYNPKGWDTHISAWDNYPKISKEDKDLFITFIVNSNSFVELQNIGLSIDKGDFIIRKVG